MRARLSLLVAAILAAGAISIPVRPALAAEQCFPQTGICVGDAFYKYWAEHGGLQQQGLPISDEFEELNPVDGKRYRVQYFERARFELHPENRAPNDVLLGLLGHEQLTAKYPLGRTAAYDGAGTRVLDNLNLAAGLAFFRLTYSNPDPQSSFKATLRDNTGKIVEALASRNGSFTSAVALRIPFAGPYSIEIIASGQWALEVTQPGFEAQQMATPLPLRLAGQGSGYSPLFKANAGTLRLTLEHDGEYFFNVRLFDGQGRYIDIPVRASGPYDGTVTVTLPKAGVYILLISADGAWTIDASQ